MGAASTLLGRAASFSIQPHVGFGLGWNWLPRGAGGGGGGGSWGNWGNGGAASLIAIPVALGIIAMVFAGRVEVRYTARPISGAGSDFVSVMIGAGS